MKAGTTSGGARASRRVARQRNLLSAARQLFVEQGFHGTGLAQISEASEIAVGQIYRDFANKEAIIAAIVEESLSAWLEEDQLNAVVQLEDRDAIRRWIEHISLEKHSPEDRRLMCELLAEVGRNQLIAEIHHLAEARLRKNLDLAIASLAPSASRQQRTGLTELIIMFSWGMTARSELSLPEHRGALQDYASSIIARELDCLCPTSDDLH